MPDPDLLRLSRLTPSLTVDDIDESVDWYTEVLGFELAHRFDDDDGQLVGAAVRAGEVELFLTQDDWQKGRDRDKGQGVRLYLTVDDVDDRAAFIRDRGGVLDHEPADREWGTRDFAVTDPSGYKLTFTTPWEEPSG